MDIVIGIIVGLIVLMLLVIAHEFGHFIMARRNGVRVLEFGIGFPPRAVAWVKDPTTHKWRRLKKSEWGKERITKTVLSENESEDAPVVAKPTENEKIIADGLVFSVNWLPIGGFCQMDGESAVDKRPGTFGHANFWKKTKILFAGVAMNWIVAFVILTVLAWTGMPNFLENQFTIEGDTRTEYAPVEVTSVAEGSPAEAAGFLAGDKILAVDGNEVRLGSDITALNEERAGREVTYTVFRTGEAGCNCDADLELTATLNEDGAEYLLGVAMQSSQTLSYSTWSAPIVGAGLTIQMTGETYKGLGEMLWNLLTGVGRLFSFDSGVRESGQQAISAVGDSVSGPVGIIGVLFPSFTAAGPTNLAFLAAVISISLACMNVLPIPALDGGRWLLIAIYKLRRKQLTKEVEERVVSRAFIVLLAIMAVITVIDIVRFF